MIEIRWSFDKEFLPYTDLNKVPYDKSGIYFIYNMEKELMYIGIAKMLKKRIIQHFNGGSNTVSYSKDFKYFSLIYESDPDLRSLFELYFIQEYKPPFNKVRNPRFTCKGLKKDGSKCGMYVIKNGYCRHHVNQNKHEIEG